MAVGQPGWGKASQTPFPMLAPTDFSSSKDSFFSGSGSLPYKHPGSVIAQSRVCCAASPEQSKGYGSKVHGRLFGRGVWRSGFLWSRRQLCFLWEPRDKCLGNLLTALSHFAEAVGAECSSLRWSDHRSGDAGCSCPRVPEVSAFPPQPSTDRSGGFPAPAQQCVSLGLDTQHGVRDRCCSDWCLVN